MRRTQTNQTSGGLVRGLSGSLLKLGHTSPEMPMRSSADAANFLEASLKKTGNTSNDKGSRNVSINDESMEKGAENRTNSAYVSTVPNISITETQGMLKSLD